MAVTVEPVFPPQVLTWEGAAAADSGGRAAPLGGKAGLLPVLCSVGQGAAGLWPPGAAAAVGGAMSEGFGTGRDAAGDYGGPPQPYRSGDGAWCEHLHGAHGAVAVPLPGRCVGGGTAGGGGGVLPSPCAVAPLPAGDGARAGAGPAPRRFLVGGGGGPPGGGAVPAGGYEVVCLPYDPELGPLDPLGP